jgi:ribulose-phosphate 3-epimerase
MQSENKKIQIAPSILTADFGHLKDEIDRIAAGGCDQIHVDVMDGHFVPNMAMGPTMVKNIRRCTDLPLDVHLMIDNPETFIPAFVNAGADTITVHWEACPQIHHTISLIHSLGVKAGCALNPGTPNRFLEPILGDLDLILLMTVNPGFGGQKFIPYSVEKIRAMRQWLTEQNRTTDIEVDGGINAGTCTSVIEAGATVLVMGSVIYDGVDPEGNMKKMRQLVDARA